jgi:two-component system, chemotaxis family, protein-glutamate methylesterase/glutaminase
MHDLGPLSGRDLIVVGGSAGALAPLTTIIQGLPVSFSACLLVVLHSPPENAGNLAQILSRVTSIPVATASHDQPIGSGILVAPRDHHVLVTPGLIHVTRGPTENGFRPAIDPLFRTAAHAYGERVIGVLLSGALDDGVYGLREIKARGGLVVVQDPDEAEIPTLPRKAIAHVDVDHVLAAVAIAPLLARETELPQHNEVAMGVNDLEDPQLPGNKTDIQAMNSTLGPPSGLTCPDCGGALWEINERQLVRFQCHVGHHYSPESLVVQHDYRVENALWTAVRALEERAELRRRMAHQTEAAGLATVSESFAEQARSAERQANDIRDVLSRSGGRASAAETVETPARRKRPRQR